MSVQCNEEWRDVIGYEGLYQVSNHARIRSVERIVKHSKGGDKLLRSKEKKPFHTSNGRMRVELSKNGVNKKHSLHVIVAKAFVPNPKNLEEVNHKDENPKNNCPENLEWCTHLYNMNYGTRTQRASESRFKSVGMYHPKENVLMRVFVSMKEAAEFLNVSNSCITISCKKEKRLIKGYKFKFI